MANKDHPSYLDNLSQNLKPLNTPEELVHLGIAGSAKTLANKRYDGTGPDFIKIKGAGIRYPKESVISWLTKHSVLVSSLTAKRFY